MPLKFQTFYSEMGTQLYLTEEIKKPILEALPVIFDPTAGRIDKLRAALRLWRASEALGRLPQPTISNTWHPNAHNLIRLRDWVLESILGLSGLRRSFVERVFNLAIIIVDMDPPWRWVIDSVKDKAMCMEWKPRGWNDDWVENYKWWREDANL